MSLIKDWSTTAASNNAAAPNGFPENMAPSGVNDAAREVMASVRAQCQDAEWFNWGDSATRASNTSFTISGDVTSRYTANRRIKIADSSTLYGYITSSTYAAPNTTVNVSMTGNLSATMNGENVYLGILSPSNTNTAVPAQAVMPMLDSIALVKDPADTTKQMRIDAGSITTGTTRVLTMADSDIDLANATPPFVDSTAIIKGSVDPTKLVKIEADGLTTGTTRTITMPDTDVDLGQIATNTADISTNIADIGANTSAIAAISYPLVDTTEIVKDPSDATKTVRLDAGNVGTGTTSVLYVPGWSVYLGASPGDNLIIGGDFGSNPWQRGTSFAAVADGDYTADRFIYKKSGAMVHTITKETSTIPSANSLYSYTPAVMKLDVTTADSSIAAGDYCIVGQKIEGYNFLRIAQRVGFVVSFRIRASLTGVYCVFAKNSGDDRSYVSEVTVNSADTYEDKYALFTVNPSAGTWNYTNGVGLFVGICLAGGSTYQTTADSWQTGDYFCTSNQVNSCADTAYDVHISHFKVEPGVIVTPFMGGNITTELNKCKRYYQKSYSQGTAPGSLTYEGAIFGATISSSVDIIYLNSSFHEMRSVPTIVWYSGGTGAANNIRVGGSSDYSVSNTIYNGTVRTGYPRTSSTVSSGSSVTGQYTATAEL